MARLLFCLGVGFLTICYSAVGRAQNSSDQAGNLILEEIVVTAQKREESLQSVPISIDVAMGDYISQMSIDNLEELSKTVPAFHMYQSPAQSAIFIRSIGSGSSNQGFEQSVGLFVDGVYAGRERMFQVPFLDIARVEVLKGPQSVILGKNTTAGAISITTARPTDTFDARISGLYGDHGEYALTTVLSGPLKGNIAGRLAARVSGMDGYIRNTLTSGDEPDVGDLAVRGTLEWKPEAELTVLFKAEYARARQDGNALIPYIVTAGQLGLARMFDPDFVADPESGTKSADGKLLPGTRERNDLDSYNVTVTAEYAMLSDWLVTSITSYGGLEYTQATDVDHLPIDIASISLEVGSEYDQISQELRFASPVNRTVEFLGGVYYLRGNTGFLDWVPCVDFAVVPGVGLPAAFCAPARWEQTQDTASAFARATWNFTDTLRTTAGVRFTREEKDASNRLLVTELDRRTPNASPLDQAVALAVGGWQSHVIPESGRTENNWSPSLNIQWDAGPGTMLYASFVRGTKSGGFNPLEGRGDLGAWEFDSETARSIEIGAKMRFFDNRAAVNISAYTSEFSDLQVSLFNGATFTVTNASEAEVDGVEFDFDVRATEALTLSGAVAYSDARYGTFRGGPCQIGQMPATGCVEGFQDLTGVKLPFAPEWTATIVADYDWEIGTNLVSVQVEGVYSDDQLLGPDNDPIDAQSSYAKANARIALGPLDGLWEIAVIGRNLTDKITKEYANDIVGFPGGHFTHISRGRSFAVQGMLRF